jgi:hypothetical protein
MEPITEALRDPDNGISKGPDDWETKLGSGDSEREGRDVEEATRGPEVGSGRRHDVGDATRGPEDGGRRRHDVG